ncbi:MAG: T9SS type A sorting domain-containing protein [bacterium]
MRKSTIAILFQAGFVTVQVFSMFLACSSVIAATIIDDIFYEGAESSIAVRYVVFDQDGAHFDGEYTGIDYPATALPAGGTVEILIRTQRSGDVVMDTRGADPRLPGDLVLSIASGPYGSSTLQDAVAGQVFFTIDPDGGNNPGLLPGVLSSTIITDGAWHIISVSYGSGGLAMYIDGVLEDTAPSITAQPIYSIVTLGDFDDALITAAFSILGEILRFRTSDVQNDVTPLCEGLPTLEDDCSVITGILPDVVLGRAPLLEQNTPNPFNPSTTLAFELFEQSTASLFVYDVAGRLVAVLLGNEILNEGRHETTWNGRNSQGLAAPSGTYFYRLTAGKYTETRRMVLVR